MHIGFVEPHLLTVGGIRRIIEIANRLQKRKHRVEIYTPKGRDCYWLKNTVPVQKISKIPHRNFDILLFNLAEQYQIVLEAKAKKKVFWCLAPEAMYKHPDIPIRALHHDFCLMANSQFTVDYIKRHIRIKQKIPIIPGGVNPIHFHHEPNTQKIYDVLYYGSPRPWKGGAIVEGALRNTNYKILKMQGLGTPQMELYKLYNQATLFVSASLYEGFSFPQLEAMACGTPVITTDDGGSRDYVRTGENALVVTRTPHGILQGVNVMIKNRDLRRKFHREGLKTASEPRFNWDNVTTAVENTFNNFLKS